MIDPITEMILEKDDEVLQEKALDHILEGYNLQCQQCGRVITMIKDGTGPLECCSRRMIVMSGNPMEPAEDIEEVRKTLKGQVVEPDFQVPVGSVNFSPYNQADAQEKAEKNRIKQENRPYLDRQEFIEEKQALKKLFSRAQKAGKEGIIIKKYVPYEKDTAAGRKARGYITKEEIQYILTADHKTLEELKKTRSLVGRIATSLTDPAYRQRKADLMKLRKKTPGWWRKGEERKVEKPGVALKVAKARKIIGDPLKAAQLRRSAAKKLGGYYKTGVVKQQAQEKRQREEKTERKRIKKEYKGQMKGLKQQQKGERKAVKKGGPIPGKQTVYRKPAAPRKKEASGGAWMSMESQLVKDMEVFQEKGFETKPKGWTDASVKKFGKSLVKGGGKKEGFFKKCVKKMEGKVANPEGFCAAVKDEAHDSTYWRGKGKTPQEVAKKVKRHKNV